MPLRERNPALASSVYTAPAPAPTVAARYTPHARQLAVHNAPEGDVWACMGYGTGKTELSVFEALSLACVTHPGYEGIVAAPTYPLLTQSWLASWRRLIPSAWYRVCGNNDRIEVHVDQGVSTIWLRSTVKLSSIDGINAAWLVFDEASRELSPDPIRVLSARVRRGYPDRQRRKLIIGPPQTRSHWTARDYGTGPDADHTGDVLAWRSNETDARQRRRVVRGRTRDNPFLPPGYEAALRARPGSTKAWCKQWLDAEFGSVEGQVYEAFSRDLHVVPAASLAGRVWRDVIAGVDWGWAKMGVMLVVGLDGTGDAYVLHEEAHDRMNVDDTPTGWLPLMLRVCARWKVRRMFCDPSRPGDIESAGKKLRGVTRVYPANNDVDEGIRRITARLEWARDRTVRAPGVLGPARILGRPALYVSDACPYTLGEFEGYQRAKERDGSFTEAPAKRNDHAMDALRYAEMETDSAA